MNVNDYFKYKKRVVVKIRILRPYSIHRLEVMNLMKIEKLVPGTL